MIRFAAHSKTVFSKIVPRRLRYGREGPALGELGKPRIVHHDHVVRAGFARKIEHLFLEKIGVRQLDDLDASGSKLAPFAGGGLERTAFDAGVNRNRENLVVLPP